MDPIKNAFQKIKKDIIALQQQISELRQQINQIQSTQNSNQNPLTNIPTQNNYSTDKQTQNLDTSTHIPTHNLPLETQKSQNLTFSTGNGGVPTDKQTNRQTDKQTQNTPQKYAQSQQNPTQNTFQKHTDFQKATEILQNLDNIKKGIRLKFKRLTPQEMLIFSTLYTLEEQTPEQITYKYIANQTKLSESSIRDYINRLRNKGIPIQKIKQNNKTILLKISEDLKKIATLPTIIKLREL